MSMDCGTRKGLLTSNQLAKLRPGKVLGQGAFACAYESENDPERVIKLTTDVDDAAAFAELGDKGLKALPKVYNVYSLLDSDQKPQEFFAIEVEKVTPLAARSDDARSVSLLNDLLAGYGVGSLPKKIGANGKARLKRECVDAQDTGFLQDAKVCDTVVKEAIGVYEDLQKAGYAFEDAHEGNWGRNKDGKLVAIDLGYSSTAPRGKKLNTLAGAKMKNRRKRKWKRTYLGADEVVEAPKEDNFGFFIGLAILGVSIYAVSKANWTKVK